MKRRDFLQALAVGAAVPSIGVAAHAATPSRLRVLVLAPKKFSSRFLQALTSPMLELRFVDAGLTTNSAARASSTALEHDRPDVLLSLGDGFAQTLRPILEQYALPAICSEFGAKIASPFETSPFVRVNSLHLWQSEWALGAYAASQRKTNIGRGNTAVLLCSLREAGYDLPFAFKSGFESVGGRLLETIFFDAAKPDQNAILQQLCELRPAHLHVLASDAGNLEWVRQSRLPISASALTPIQATSAFSGGKNSDPVRLLAEQSVALLEAARVSGLDLLRGLRQAPNTQQLELYKNGSRQALAFVSEMHPHLNELRGGVRSGYTNTYLV